MEDCAEFVVNAGYSDAVNGEIVNAGLGRDVSINELALKLLEIQIVLNTLNIFIRKVRFKSFYAIMIRQNNY